MNPEDWLLWPIINNDDEDICGKPLATDVAEVGFATVVSPIARLLRALVMDDATTIVLLSTSPENKFSNSIDSDVELPKFSEFNVVEVAGLICDI